MKMLTIRELRERQGMTQVDLAFALKVTPSTVYNWEKGRAEPRAAQVRAMAQIFGVSMDAIAFEADEVKNAA